MVVVECMRDCQHQMMLEIRYGAFTRCSFTLCIRAGCTQALIDCTGIIALARLRHGESIVRQKRRVPSASMEGRSCLGVFIDRLERRNRLRVISLFEGGVAIDQSWIRQKSVSF